MTTKNKIISLRIDSTTEKQIEKLKKKIEDEFGIEMDNSKLIRYIVNQLSQAEGVK